MYPQSLALHCMDWSEWSRDEIKRIDASFIKILPSDSTIALAERSLALYNEVDPSSFDRFITEAQQETSPSEDVEDKFLVIPEALIMAALVFGCRELGLIIITNLRNNIEHDITEEIKAILIPEIDTQFSFNSEALMDYFKISNLPESDNRQKAVWLALFSFSTTPTLLYKALRFGSIFPFVRRNILVQEFMKRFDEINNRPIEGCLKCLQCFFSPPIPERDFGVTAEERKILMDEINAMIEMLTKNADLFKEVAKTKKVLLNRADRNVSDDVEDDGNVSMEFEIVSVSTTAVYSSVSVNPSLPTPPLAQSQSRQHSSIIPKPKTKEQSSNSVNEKKKKHISSFERKKMKNEK